MLQFILLEYEPPKTETEQKICEAFAEALDMTRVSAAADFFSCGGTSLSAAVLISTLSGEEFTLSFQDISTHPTPRELAEFLESRRGTTKPAMDRDAYPLTKTQMGIYLESQTGGSKETYTLPYLTRAAKGKTLIAVTHDDRLAPYFDHVIDMNAVTSGMYDAPNGAAVKGGDAE